MTHANSKFTDEQTRLWWFMSRLTPGTKEQGYDEILNNPDDMSHIVSDAVWDLVHRDLIGEGLVEFAMEYLQYRIGADWGAEPGWDVTSGAVHIGSKNVAISGPSAEQVRDVLTDKWNLRGVWDKYPEGVNPQFFASIFEVLEAQVSHWKRVLTAYSETPFSVDESNRSLGRLAYVLQSAVDSGAVNADFFKKQPEALEEGELGFLDWVRDVETKAIPHFMYRYVPAPSDLRPMVEGVMISQQFKQYEWSQEDSKDFDIRVSQSFPYFVGPAFSPPTDIRRAGLADILGTQGTNLPDALKWLMGEVEKANPDFNPDDFDETLFDEAIKDAKNAWTDGRAVLGAELDNPQAQAAAVAAGVEGVLRSFDASIEGFPDAQRLLAQRLDSEASTESVDTLKKAAGVVENWALWIGGGGEPEAGRAPFEIPEDLASKMANYLYTKGQNFDLSKDLAPPNWFDLLSGYWNRPETQVYLADQQGFDDHQDLVDAQNTGLGWFNTYDKAHTAVGSWHLQKQGVFTVDGVRQGADPEVGVVALDATLHANLAGQLYQYAQEFPLGSPQLPKHYYFLLEKFSLGSFAIDLAKDAEKRGVARDAENRAQSYTSTELASWLLQNEILMSPQDKIDTIFEIRKEGDVDLVLATISANRGYYLPRAQTAAARQDPYDFVRQHFIETGVLTEEASRKFEAHLENGLIFDIGRNLATYLAKGGETPGVKNWVKNQVAINARPMDLDEALFKDFQRRLSIKLPVPEGAQVPELPPLPSTQRARLGPNALFSSISPLFETEEPEFLSFLSEQLGGLLKDYSFAAVPQADPKELEGLILFAQEERDRQMAAWPSIQQAYQEEQQGLQLLGGAPDDIPAIDEPVPGGLMNLTDAEIARHASINLTRPGQTPEQFMESQLPGLRQKFETTPFAAVQRRRQTQEAEQQAEETEVKAEFDLRTRLRSGGSPGSTLFRRRKGRRLV